MLSPRRAAWIAAFGLTVLVTSACAEPPNKELHQAQGAIDAARAAGAEQYAPTELAAAVKALDQATSAVAQRDYPLSLAPAHDRRERAQNAAREAASGRAAARSRAERLVAEVTTALALATERLERPDTDRLPKTALTAPREQVAAVQRALQEAGTALGRD